MPEDEPLETTEGEPDPPTTGGEVGPYRVLRTLGQGGMGEVVLAYDHRLDRQVAIKRIRHGVSSDDSESGRVERERFRREARIAAGLSHPAIVQVHDILFEDDGDAIVMEFIDGPSLADRLRVRHLSVGETLCLATQVAEGLAEAHQAGLVHRDLKSENIMVTASQHAKILDFGLAKVLSKSALDETLTHPGAVLGTIRAMSPEQAAGLEIDQRSDLFSFGVLMFEMLTARSPFRGSTPLETLLRVQNAPPEPLGDLRPDVPPALTTLIESLLDKDPDRRPQDASTVARQLKDLESHLDVDTAILERRIPSNLDEASTGSWVATPTLVSSSSFDTTRTAAPTGVPPPARHGGSGRRGRLAPALGVLLVVLAAVLFSWALRFRAQPEIRVAVLPPQHEDRDSLAFVASAAYESTLQTLVRLEGLVPLESGQLGEASSSPEAAARATASGEVLSLIVGEQGAQARIRIRRLRGSDAGVLWSDAFEVSTDPRDARLIAEAVAVQIERAYREHGLRAGFPELQVRDEDFTDYVRLKQDLNSGQPPGEDELRRLEKITRGSPRFLEAHVVAGSVAVNLFSESKDPDLLTRAEILIDRAMSLAPNDSRTLILRFKLALARGQTETARGALGELEKVLPGDVQTLISQSSLAAHVGDLEEAIELMRSVVERWPDWRNFYRLARLETQSGRIDDARGHLEELLQRAPGHPRGMIALAHLELTLGDLERAEALYRRLIELEPHRSLFTNLGAAQFVLGRFEEAAASYREALRLEPGHATALKNLADVEAVLGNRQAAADLYQRALEVLSRRQSVAHPNAADRMLEAQCLAGLGESQRAIELTLSTLQQSPENSEIAYRAARVYALVGEKASALAAAKKALAMGMDSRWFKAPEFELIAGELPAAK